MLNYAILEDKKKEKDQVTEDVDLHDAFQKNVEDLIHVLEKNKDYDEANQLRAVTGNQLNPPEHKTNDSKWTNEKNHFLSDNLKLGISSNKNN